MNKMRFIYPIVGCMYDLDDIDRDIDAEELTSYKELLNNKIKEYQDYTCCGQGMGQFFDENADIKSKLISADWSFEEFNGVLYGVTTVELTDTIDEKGIADLKKWISGQNSDGLGECIEQHIYDIDDGCRLSVSLWSPINYFIYTEEEFLHHIKESTDSTQIIKPTCKLIGEDGNIFNLTGVARRTLIEHGQDNKADEMCKRVTTSSSYDEALRIIGEYVNIV